MRSLGLLAILGALTLAGCATRMVSSHVELNADFEKYRTYDWGPADALPTGDARLDNNAFLRDYIQGAIEKELAGRRLTLVANDPDLLIHWHTTVARELDLETHRREYHGNPNGPPSSYEPEIVEYEMGTLLIDAVDARTQRLVWRGWARETYSGVINNQERLRLTVVSAITDIMKRFPKTAS